MNPVPGNTLADQAVRAAGALAELSITELIMAPNSILQTRITDLPGVLVNAAIGVRLTARALELTIEKQARGLVWSSDNPEHAAAFAAALK